MCYLIALCLLPEKPEWLFPVGTELSPECAVFKPIMMHVKDKMETRTVYTNCLNAR